MHDESIYTCYEQLHTESRGKLAGSLIENRYLEIAILIKVLQLKKFHSRL